MTIVESRNGVPGTLRQVVMTDEAPGRFKHAKESGRGIRILMRISQ
jgi:hypothetical protein